MKRVLTTAACIVIAAFLVTTSQVFAAGDTLVVYATPNSLNKVINGDTLANGTRAHTVYRLVSLDTTYIYDGTITAKSSITVFGVPHATTGKLPCIQPDVLLDGSIPATMFTLNGNKSTGTFKNLYLLGLSLNNSPSMDGIAIQVSADSVKLIVDNVVFDEWLTFAIGYNGNWDKFFITNCKFRNMVHPNQWYIGEALRNEWPGAVPTDTVLMRYNTFLCLNGYVSCPVTKAYVRYIEFSHNSVVYTFKNPFFIFNATNAKINDNLFYGAWAGAISKTEYPWWDQLWSPEVGSIIDFDALDSAKIRVFAPSLPAKPSGVIDTAAEKLRTVQLKNNVYFMPTAITSYWQAWNDTAHVDSVYTPTWMNTRTTNMVVTDKTTWPGIVATGTQNVDPGFGSSIAAVLNPGAGYGIGLLNWFKQCRTGTLLSSYWGYKKTSVGTSANWVPTWPLPETQDMKYSNASLKTAGSDGRPIGDPYWFNGTNGGVTDVPTVESGIPQEFTLSEAYPNPFNPTTNLDYTLTRSGAVNLKVYNVLGQVVATVINGEEKQAGTYSVGVNMSRMTSGIYFAVLEQGNNRIVRKLMLLK